MAAGHPLPMEDEDNTFNILVATDLHLGFKHLDPVIRNDAMNTFEEVLQHARDNHVDFVLLGGDLFHENKPPRHVMYNCLQLLRRYCVGERPQTFQRVNAGPSHDVAGDTANLNISMPVFSIHGNHDEPTGPQHLSVMDLFHSSGLLHYFGKTLSVDQVRLQPLLLEKGETKLDLYGIGSVRSDKLHQMYRHGHVTMDRPDTDPDDHFSIFVLHQNRVRRPDNSHVEESFVHDFLDLVFWGHEHESKIVPKRSEGDTYWLSQPGSTVATQFRKSETVKKHVGLLTVCRKRWQLKPIPLRTVRQLYVEDLTPRLGPGESPQDEAVVERLMQDCRNRVEALLAKAEETRKAGQPKEPLIRIKIEQERHVFSCSTSRFGIEFVDRVANPDTILAFGKLTKTSENGSLDNWTFPHNANFPIFTVEKLAREELQKQKEKPQIVHEADMFEGIERFVNQDDNKAFEKVLHEQLTEAQAQLKGNEQLLLSDETSRTETDMDFHVKSLIDKAVLKYREERSQSTQVGEASTEIAAETESMMDDDAVGEDVEEWRDAEFQELEEDFFEVLSVPVKPQSSTVSLKGKTRGHSNREGRLDSPAESSLSHATRYAPVKTGTDGLSHSAQRKSGAPTAPRTSFSWSTASTSAASFSASCSPRNKVTPASRSALVKSTSEPIGIERVKSVVDGAGPSSDSIGLSVSGIADTNQRHRRPTATKLAHSPAEWLSSPSRPKQRRLVGHETDAIKTRDRSETRVRQGDINRVRDKPTVNSNVSGPGTPRVHGSAFTRTHLVSGCSFESQMITSDSEDDDLLILNTSDAGDNVWTPAAKNKKE